MKKKREGARESERDTRYIVCAREIDIVRETNRKRVNNTHTHTQREIQRQRDVR